MSRVFTSGFELNSLTTGVEFFIGTSNTGSIQNATVNGGTYAYRNNPSGTVQALQFQYGLDADAFKTQFYRFDYYATTRPASDSLVFLLLATDNVSIIMRLRGTGTGLKAMRSDNTQVGSSFTLNAAQWYRIEIKVLSHASAGTIDVLVDGVSVVSATGVATDGSNIGYAQFGSGVGLTHDYYIDNIAINSTAGSVQNSYPGAGNVICLRPNAAGDNANFARGGADSGANWSQCDEVTPNDATDYVESGTNGHLDEYNVGASGIGAADTVNVVHIGARFTNDVADGLLATKVRVRKASGGTATESAGIILNTTGWRTNGLSGVAYNPYPITQYADPDASPWTQATLDTMQVGAKITTAGTDKIRLSAVWAMVDYTPATNQILRPISDIAANGWLSSSGSDLFAMLDEATEDDADYDYSPTNPTTQYMEVLLGPGSAPVAGTRTISTRLQAIGQTTHFVVDVRQGASSLQTFAHDVTVAEGVVQFDDELTATVTDYTDLRLRVTASA